MKKCNKCKISKPLGQMVVNRRSADGRASKCKQCDAIETETWRKNNPEKKRANSKAYRDANSKQAKERSASWRRNNPERSKSAALSWYRNNTSKVRDTKLKRTYGIGQLDYLALLLKQNYKCAICGTLDSKCHSGRFHIDHCHKTKKIRGLLCTTCNTALGKFHDSTQLLQNAIHYLQQHQVSQ